MEIASIVTLEYLFSTHLDRPWVRLRRSSHMPLTLVRSVYSQKVFVMAARSG